MSIGRAFETADGKGGAYRGDVIDGAFSFALEEGLKVVSVRAYRPSKMPGPGGAEKFDQYLPQRYKIQYAKRAAG